MSTRFNVNTFAVVASAFLVAVSLAFSAGPLTWIAFGVSAAVVVAAVLALAATGLQQRSAGYGTLALVGAWSLVAALVFSGTALMWLVFADAIAVGAIGLVSLVRHEITTERVVHTLEVRETVGENGYARV